MNAIDLFAGAGGLSVALRESGYSIVLANEINPQFADTHKLNFPTVPIFNGSLKFEITAKRLYAASQRVL